MNGLITNLIRGRYFPLSKPNDAVVRVRARSTRRPTPQELISLQEPKLVVVAFECWALNLSSGVISLGRVPTLLLFPINQLLPSHFRAPSNRIQSPAPLFLCVV